MPNKEANFRGYYQIGMDFKQFTHDDEFHNIVNNKETLRRYTEKFLNNIIDEITLGIIFDTHRKYKMNAFDLDGNKSPAHDDDEEFLPNVEIFGQGNMKKTQDCECPICDKAVAATRFAPHLEGCMGMGRNRFRNTSRRVATNNNENNNNKDRENSTYTDLPSDDEDEWNSGDKRRKKKYKNGNKKGKGTPKKTNNREPSENFDSNVDIEGDEDADVNLREFLHDNSNHSSPADSVSSTSSTNSKKKDKPKNKKNNKRDNFSKY